MELAECVRTPAASTGSLQHGLRRSGANYARVKRETAADRIEAVTGLLREVFADRYAGAGFFAPHPWSKII